MGDRAPDLWATSAVLPPRLLGQPRGLRDPALPPWTPGLSTLRPPCPLPLLPSLGQEIHGAPVPPALTTSPAGNRPPSADGSKTGSFPSGNSRLTNLTSLPRASRDIQRDRHTQNNSPPSPGRWPPQDPAHELPGRLHASHPSPLLSQNDPVQPSWGLCSLCLPGMFFSSDPTAIPTMAHSFTFLKDNFIHLYFWLHCVFIVACRLLSSCGSWASPFGGCSCFGALALELRLPQWCCTGSVVAVPGL